MKRHFGIFMSGALVVIPLGVTVWIIVWIGKMMGGLGYQLMETTGLLEQLNPTFQWFAGCIGVAIVVVAVYLVGLLANFWLFRGMFRLLDRILGRVPGIKTVYESVRDLMKLFGGEAGSIGHVVLYKPRDSRVKMLGIVTNENPPGRPDGDDSVLVYLPMGYMIGGPIVFASPDDIEPLDMSVEAALKLAATAFVGIKERDELPQKTAADTEKR